MSDYRTLLRHAGLPEHEVERIAARAEADDTQAKTSHKQKGDDTLDEDDEEVHPDDQQVLWEQGIEKLIRLIGRKTGVEADGYHGIYIEGNEVQVSTEHGKWYTIAQLMDFSNKIAAEGIGSNVRLAADAEQRITISFDLIQRG